MRCGSRVVEVWGQQHPAFRAMPGLYVIIAPSAGACVRRGPARPPPSPGLRLRCLCVWGVHAVPPPPTRRARARGRRQRHNAVMLAPLLSSILSLTAPAPTELGRRAAIASALLTTLAPRLPAYAAGEERSRLLSAIQSGGDVEAALAALLPLGARLRPSRRACTVR
jgi:hypothetical protein